MSSESEIRFTVADHSRPLIAIVARCYLPCSQRAAEPSKSLLLIASNVSPGLRDRFPMHLNLILKRLLQWRRRWGSGKQGQKVSYLTGWLPVWLSSPPDERPGKDFTACHTFHHLL